MIAPISVATGSRCGATRQICFSRRKSGIACFLIKIVAGPRDDREPAAARENHSAVSEHGRALLHEGCRSLLVVGGIAAARVVHRFAIEALFDRQLLGV